MDVLWELEESTKAKHRLYERYMAAWWPVMLQTTNGYARRRVTYVDAFAGPGRYTAGEPGSPVFIVRQLLEHAAVERMNLSRDRVHVIFVERVRARYEYLCAELVKRLGPLEDLPILIDVRHGDAGEQTERALGERGAWEHPIFAIFDSWGNVGVPLSLVSRIARSGSSEVITTFGPNWFSRREDLNTNLIDAVFGGRQYWTPADRETDPEDRWRAWLGSYRKAMERAGFEYRLQFEVVPHTGLPLHLVYGTNHPKGVQAMKDAMWKVDGNDGMGFRDPRTRGAPAIGQMGLFSGPNHDPELHELVTQRLQAGPTMVNDLQTWLLLETARWRERDAIPAVTALRDRGAVAVDPSERITTKSTVRLR